MAEIIIDFETYSGYSIDTGPGKYTRHPDADILCLGIKIDYKSPIVWHPGCDWVPEISPESFYYAHNALFDYNVWNNIGVEKYGFPRLNLSQVRDTMAIAQRFTYYGQLNRLGDLLNLNVKKDPEGKRLINLICKPTAAGTRPKLGIDYTNNDLRNLMHYCAQDTETTRALIDALPHNKLSDLEQEIWELTQRINLRGLPVDEKTADIVYSYISGYAEELTHRVPEITGGSVQRVTQVQKLRDYINSQGINCPNLQAGTVEKLLEQDLPQDVEELLELRQLMGRSSTAKYRKILQNNLDGIVYDNMRYHGAAPGRWTGQGFQLHNLPRAKVDDPEEYIRKFHAFEPVDNPIGIAKALIRPMIMAPPGYMLLVSDYSSIEARLLSWLAKNKRALDLYFANKDVYVDMACKLYHCTPDDVTKHMRQIGKVIILGCGYGMGPNRFLETAADWGIILTIEEASTAVFTYRDVYYLEKRFWYKVKDCAVYAIQNPGQIFEYNDNTFKVVKDRNGTRWLVITNPSGRTMYYNEPYVSEDKYGPVPKHYGINPYSKKWSSLALIPGRITENIDQGLARDIMANGLLNVEREMPEAIVIGSVHDEAISLIIEEDIKNDTLTKYNQLLCDLPAWGDGIPLKAEGYIAKRYRKG